MPDREAAWLVEIESAIVSIESFTAGFEKQNFLADERTCAATAMFLVVIGEAARRLPPAARAEAPEIPWPLIVSLRNRIVHGYASIDHEICWSIVQDYLPVLSVAARRMLAARGE
jgi:uncharacterized protein with HEPN domain